MTETQTNGGGQQLQLMDFAHAEAERAEPQRLREIVRVLLRRPEVWTMVAPHFRDDGLAGSLQYDKAVAAHKVRAWDKDNDALLDAFPDLNEMKLAGAIGKELRRVYELHGGRIVKALPPPEAKAAP